MIDFAIIYDDGAEDDSARGWYAVPRGADDLLDIAGEIGPFDTEAAASAAAARLA